MDASFQSCAAQLESALPAQDGTFAASGFLGKVLALISALKAGDVQAILKAVYELLGEFVEDAGGGEIVVGAAPGCLALDWKSLLGILATILQLLGK